MKNVSKRAVVLSSLLMLAAAACGGSYVPKYLKEVQPAQAVSADSAATVVFLRHRSMLFLLPAVVTDGRDNPIADLPASSHLVARVSAGKHSFAVCSYKRCDFVDADLQAGRVYYVEIDPSVDGPLAGGGFSLRALKPSAPGWAQRKQWVSSSRQFVVDPDHRPVVDRSQPGYQESMKQYDDDAAAWKQLPESERAARTLVPDDGE